MSCPARFLNVSADASAGLSETGAHHVSAVLQPGSPGWTPLFRRCLIRGRQDLSLLCTGGCLGQAQAGDCRGRRGSRGGCAPACLGRLGGPAGWCCLRACLGCQGPAVCRGCPSACPPPLLVRLLLCQQEQVHTCNMACLLSSVASQLPARICLTGLSAQVTISQLEASCKEADDLLVQVPELVVRFSLPACLNPSRACFCLARLTLLAVSLSLALSRFCSQAAQPAAVLSAASDMQSADLASKQAFLGTGRM